MANPKQEDDPSLRPDQAGRQGSDAAETGNWRDRFPGWQTFEGKPRNPLPPDPHRKRPSDITPDPGSAIPRRPGPLVVILGITLGLLLLALIAFLMFRHSQQSSPRSPEVPQSSQLIAPASARMEDSIADEALPLRKEHHVHAYAPEHPQAKN
jgi:hypothetical protein